MATFSPNSTSSNGQLSDCIELFGAMEIIKKNWVDKWFKVNKKDEFREEKVCMQ